MLYTGHITLNVSSVSTIPWKPKPGRSAHRPYVVDLWDVDVDTIIDLYSLLSVQILCEKSCKCLRLFSLTSVRLLYSCISVSIAIVLVSQRPLHTHGYGSWRWRSVSRSVWWRSSHVYVFHSMIILSYKECNFFVIGTTVLKLENNTFVLFHSVMLILVQVVLVLVSPVTSLLPFPIFSCLFSPISSRKVASPLGGESFWNHISRWILAYFGETKLTSFQWLMDRSSEAFVHLLRFAVIQKWI